MKRERLNVPQPLEQPIDLFMDSGVFPAWGRGEKINVKEYCDFLKRNKKLISVYASVDFIPGTFGQAVTREEVEFSAKLSYDNQQIMKGWGFKPIPIFHQGEKFQWLEQYLKDGEPYIGIATRKDLRPEVQREWLDHCFTMLTSKDGVPFVKTHGFGITNISQLLRYPWYSSDSTTWALAAGYGLIYVPQMKRGKPDYSHLPTRIIMSGRPQKAWSSAKRQYEGMPIGEQEWVREWLEYIGTDVHKCRYDPITRRSACIKYFIGFSKDHVIKPFKHRHGPGFLGPHIPSLPHKTGVVPWKNLIIYNSTHMMNGQFSRIMTDAGAHNRLISYWECMKKPDEMLRRYVTQGTTDINYTPRPPSLDWADDRYISKRAMQLMERTKSYGQDDAG
jgi:hypothetical protein